MLDYKKIIKQRETRVKILRALSFIPDKTMLKIQYYIKTGHRLNLKNPKRFTEKLQWYKLYYKNPLMIQCVDKYDVRDYVKSKGLEDILIPCYGVFDSVDDIDWDALPDQFVMKDTLGGGGTSVVIVKDKASEDLEQLKEQARHWTLREAHTKGSGREWPYYCGKKHRIIFEKYLSPLITQEGLIDYKFFCFDGRPTWIYVMADRELGNGVGVGVYNSDFEKQDVLRNDERPLTRIVDKPINFELMKEISAKLSEEFPEARIDLYEVNGEVKFGEVTFFDGSGYMTFAPDSFDEKFGEAFILPESRGGGYSYRLIIANHARKNQDLIDYKFFCFDGKVEFIYVMGEREVGNSVKVSIFDRDFNKLPVLREGDEEYTDASKPEQYDVMVRIAEKLSEDFPHVRVDLYNVDGHIYFGELTFFNASGYMKYKPNNFDYQIGAKLKLRQFER